MGDDVSEDRAAPEPDRPALSLGQTAYGNTIEPKCRNWTPAGRHAGRQRCDAFVLRRLALRHGQVPVALPLATCRTLVPDP
ncbi:hypothetical protein NPS74_21625, partial [Cutibacterium acnes subsp. acnes]|nr:hypothetical protein [Cutibacterium acnes subsp. acnes]